MVAALHLPAGTASRGAFTVDLSRHGAAWDHTSLRVVELAPGRQVAIDTGDEEVLILPLAGSCRVEVGDEGFDLAGRTGVFTGPSDFAYAPIESTLTITSADGGRFALPGAKAKKRLTARYQPADAIPIELRGAGSCSRQIVNVCTPDSFEADHLIVVEAYVPAGNWATYPPHKHDTSSGTETALEEIYYFEIPDGPGGPGMAYHRQHTADTRPMDLIAEVRSGDVVLVPYGWHGPTMAAPGYDAYWLNVMAGPTRQWLICEDPAHEWVRGTWADQAMDPRLPLPGFADATTRQSWGR